MEDILIIWALVSGSLTILFLVFRSDLKEYTLSYKLLIVAFWPIIAVWDILRSIWEIVNSK